MNYTYFYQFCNQVMASPPILTGPTNPKLDILTGSTLDRPAQASSSAAPAPPAPVGQRSQTGATSARPTSTNNDGQKPPDLLEQRRG